MKRYLNLSVYDAAVQRLRSLYDNGDTVVVSFSGGKDSTYQSYFMKEVCGMNPLCVCFETTFATDLGKQNLDNILENKCTELKNQNDIPYFYSKNNFYTEYREWISENNIKNLLVIKPTVGNWLNIHTQVKDISNQNNINIVEIIKEYDTLTWPHATHGFFRFKEKIPKFLSEIEMLI